MCNPARPDQSCCYFMFEVSVWQGGGCCIFFCFCCCYCCLLRVFFCVNFSSVLLCTCVSLAEDDRLNVSEIGSDKKYIKNLFFFKKKKKIYPKKSSGQGKWNPEFYVYIVGMCSCRIETKLGLNKKKWFLLPSFLYKFGLFWGFYCSFVSFKGIILWVFQIGWQSSCDWSPHCSVCSSSLNAKKKEDGTGRIQLWVVMVIRRPVGDINTNRRRQKKSGGML